jgi:hypothetical protein
VIPNLQAKGKIMTTLRLPWTHHKAVAEAPTKPVSRRRAGWRVFATFATLMSLIVLGVRYLRGHQPGKNDHAHE